MPRHPKPPDISPKKPFVLMVVEAVFRPVIVLWMYAQIIGLIFLGIWNISSPAFREFMFRDFITYWDAYSRQLLPTWFFKIPTWNDPMAWMGGGLVLLYVAIVNGSMPPLEEIIGAIRRMNFTDNSKPSSADKSPENAEEQFRFDPEKFITKK